MLVTAGFALLLLLFTSSTALAYVPSVTCGPPPNRFQCEPGEESKPIAWTTSCVVVHLDEKGTSAISIDEVERVTRQSLDIWSDIDCSYMTPIFGGFTDEDRVGYNSLVEDNANIITFRDDFWPHTGNILALTSVTFDRGTGEIVDADIEFNTANFQYTASDLVSETVIDLQNTMVHELGHLFGLDHTPVKTATMYASAPEGELSKRNLDPDDILGMCETYPPEKEADAHICQRHTIGFYQRSEYAMNEGPEPDGCSIVSPRTKNPPSAGWLIGGFILGLGLWVRRRT